MRFSHTSLHWSTRSCECFMHFLSVLTVPAKQRILLTSCERRGVARLATERCGAATNYDGFHFEATLQKLLPLSDKELRSWVRENRDVITLDFLLWLADWAGSHSHCREDDIELLGAKLTALRERIDSEEAYQLLKILEKQSVLPSSSNDINDDELKVQNWETDVHRRGPSEGSGLAELKHGLKHAAHLAQVVQARKATSVTELLGRAPVDLENAERSLTAATAADRILEALLLVPDRKERLALLPEAFTSPEKGAQALPEIEMLSTTPLRLLQAVNLALARLENHRADIEDRIGHNLPSNTPRQPAQNSKLALMELKKDIFEFWDSSQ